MSAIFIADAHDLKHDEPPGFWRKAARALDGCLEAYLERRTRRAIAPATLRRCRRDVARFRQLMPRLDPDAAGSRPSGLRG